MVKITKLPRQENGSLSDKETPSRVEVWKMFDRIAPRYDLLNRLLSCGRDVAWRKKVSRHLPDRTNMSVLDLATGTADLLISLYGNSGRIKTGVGMDMAGEMLKIAQKKINAGGYQQSLSVIQGNAINLPFEAGSFDAVTIAFGIRNLTDVPLGLRQMHRVLNDGGRALILEFSLPENWLMKRLYLLYFRYVLPVVGSIISGDSYAYRYLNKTVETFPYGTAFCAMMEQAGFKDVRAHRLTFGIASIYEGTHRNDEKGMGVLESVRLMEDRIKTLLSSGSRKSVVRVEVDVENTSPLEWLGAQSFSQSTYWRDRENSFEMAGVGVADLIDDSTEPNASTALSRIKKVLDDTEGDARYYGGMRFDPDGQQDESWAAFGCHRFVLPRFELFRGSSRSLIVCNILPERDAERIDEILDELHSLSWAFSESFEPITVAKREDSPDYDRWCKMIASALDSFDSGRFQKIVLARKSTLHLNAPVRSSTILRKLADSATDCFHFCYQPQPDTCFLGATPERLYYRSGDDLKCEAIAGTRPRGNTPEEDRKLGEQLMASDKDIREHKLVVDSICESLTPLVKLSAALDKIPGLVLKLEKVQHLITRMEWKINDNTVDAELLTALHPTPAVGGYPKSNICREIEKLENFDRGWYAGPVGWIGRDEAEFAVAIRSALLNQNVLSLFAGAGIVKGSQAKAEWEEIDNKMSGFIKVLG